MIQHSIYIKSTLLPKSIITLINDIPWTINISALAPEYAKAAGILAEKESKIVLAKLDATEEGAVAEKFEVIPILQTFFFLLQQDNILGMARI